MTRTRLLTLLLLAGLLAPAPAGAIMSNNDVQLWTTTQLGAKLTDQLKLRSELNFRFGDGMSEFYQYHAELGFTIRALEAEPFTVDLSLLYRQRFKLDIYFDEPSSRAEEVKGWWTEYRPWAMVTFKVRLGKFTIGDTLKLEPRLYENIPHQVRFRNNTFVAYDVIASSSYGFQIFLDVHINATLHPDAEYYRTRIYAGFMFPIAGPLGFNVFYMWQRFQTHPGWWTWHVMGTSLTFNLGR